MIALLERREQLYRLIGVTSVTVAVGALLSIHLPGDVRINYPVLYVLVVLTVGAGAVCLRFHEWLSARPYLFWPIMGGVFPVFEAVAVYFTGGIRSPFFVLFYFSLFFMGMVGGRRGAALGSITVGVIHTASLFLHGGIESRWLLRLTVTLVSFYGIAWFAAYLGNIAWQEARESSRRALRIAGLNAVNTNLSDSLDYEVLIGKIPQELCRQLGFERALLYMLDGETLTLVSAYSNQDPQRLTTLMQYLRKHPPGMDSNSVEGEVARTRRPIISPDPRSDRRVNPVVLEIAQSRCFAAAPMVAKDQLIGVIVADYFQKDHAITEEELILLSTFTSLAALAVTNNRLLVEAQQAEAFRQLDTLKTEFLATVSHELRTPLTLVKTSTDLLLEDVSDGLSPVQTRLMGTISRNIVRLAAFVEEILEMAQLEEGQVNLSKQITDLRYLVNEVAQTLHLLVSEKGQTLYLDLPEEACLVEIDRHRIQQVLTNLITNACKYTPADGKVWVRVAPDDNFVRVEVQDNGPGIPAHELEHVFEKFYRLPGSRDRVKGTGLGLAITRSLVELHGGRIAVSSASPKGALFSFCLARIQEMDDVAEAKIILVPGLRE